MAYTSWRGTVGVVKPTLRPGSLEEMIRLLPEGIGVIPLFLGIQRGTEDEFRDVMPAYEAKVAELVGLGVDLVHPEGAPPFMVHGYRGEQEIIKQWEEKLEDLKQTGEVSEAVYKKVRQEYTEKRSIAEQNLNTQVLSLKQWADLLKKRAIRLAQELETKKVKLSVEDKSSDDILKQIKETEKELIKIKIAEEQARIILQKFI